MTDAPETPAAAPPQAEAPKQSNGTALAGLIVGVISLVCALLSCIMCIVPVAIALGGVGLVLSIIGMVVAKNRGGAGAGLAKGGLICSILGIVLPILFWILATAGCAVVSHYAQQATQPASRPSGM